MNQSNLIQHVHNSFQPQLHCVKKQLNNIVHVKTKTTRTKQQNKNILRPNEKIRDGYVRPIVLIIRYTTIMRLNRDILKTNASIGYQCQYLTLLLVPILW